jgi:hypothetical protein
MGKKANWEEDPDGWSKPMGKKGRGTRNEEHNLASPLPSSTRNGEAYQRSDVTKEDDQKGISVFRLFGCTSEEKENVAQLSTGTIAAHAVANAAASMRS